MDSSNDSIQDLIVKTYELIGVFQYQRARSLLRSIPSQSLPSHWTAYIASLTTFIDADESYYTFSYLSPKNSRRDALGNMHISLLDEFQKVLQPFEVHVKSANLPLPRRKEAEFFAKLILDTSYIIKIHSHMITLYRTLSNPQSNVVYLELIKFLDKVEKQVDTYITHPNLTTIKTNINTELFILHKIFLAEAQMSLYYQFRETVFNVYQSKADLNTWKMKMERDNGKPSSNLHLNIPLFLWLSAFINSMISKMTLFFFKPLWRQERLTEQTDMRNWVSKLEIPYPLMIESFCNKTDCTFFCLILEAEGMEYYSPDGYVCPDPSEEDANEPLTGLKSWPVIFSVPYIDEVPLPTTINHIPATHHSLTSSSSSPNLIGSGPIPATDAHLLYEHLPSIVVLLQDNADELNLFKPRPLIQFFQKKSPDLGISYAMFKVTQRISAVAVFRKKIKQDDQIETAIVDLRAMMTSNLKNTKIYQKLIPKD